MTKDNNLLGKFDLSGIPPAPRGVPQIEVTFDLDANGILHVSACDKSTGRSNKIEIRNERGRLSQAEIDRMVADAKRFEHEDNEQRERVSSRNGLEAYVFQVKQALNEYGDRLSNDDRQKAQSMCDETLAWIDANQLAEKCEYDDRLKQLQRVCQGIMAKLHTANSSNSGQSCGQQAYQQPHQGPVVEEVD
ncbi:unnamed protein product [Toxocara canis]|uniref:Heat shock protein 70 A2 n=1 Tax=Toxocara canis TaxID=6265 RepID=A0A183UEE2_TOXCA|nr:unnamed protein product [Toxocara canis]